MVQLILHEFINIKSKGSKGSFWKPFRRLKNSLLVPYDGFLSPPLLMPCFVPPLSQNSILLVLVTSLERVRLSLLPVRLTMPIGKSRINYLKKS